jgi:hypothetical protein
MNSVERVATTIGLREPDRVPVDLHNFQVAALASGLPMSEFFRDGEPLAMRCSRRGASSATT